MLWWLVAVASCEEYCQWESFNATCGRHQLIVVTSAVYGRMRVGRCVPYDYYVGCSTDVIDHLASRCSARRHCVVPIPAPELFKVHPCRKDLVAYMDATYQCVTGPSDLPFSINQSINHWAHSIAVSYTHLTLPTILRV